MTLPTTGDLATLCAQAAAEAGRWLLEWRADRETLDVGTKSGPTDVVTEADRAAEEQIRARLLAAVPGAAWWGEETGRHTAPSEGGRQSGLEWVVDPVDGTVNFLYGLPGWSVSVAAAVDGAVTAGAVAVPTYGELFVAGRGQGAWVEGARGRRSLAVTTCSDLGQALVATGFAYDATRRAAQGRAVGRMLGRVRDIRRAGAASVDLCAVAAGRVDAYVESGLQPWDRAAGALIAQEAGAVVDEHEDGSVVATGPALRPALLTLLAEVGLLGDQSSRRSSAR